MTCVVYFNQKSISYIAFTQQENYALLFCGTYNRAFIVLYCTTASYIKGGKINFYCFYFAVLYEILLYRLSETKMNCN